VLHKFTPPFNQALSLFTRTQTCENPPGGALPYTKFDNTLNRVFQLNKTNFYLESFQKKFNLSTSRTYVQKLFFHDFNFDFKSNKKLFSWSEF
jgi:hypothetical protein